MITISLENGDTVTIQDKSQEGLFGFGKNKEEYGYLISPSVKTNENNVVVGSYDSVYRNPKFAVALLLEYDFYTGIKSKKDNKGNHIIPKKYEENLKKMWTLYKLKVNSSNFKTNKDYSDYKEYKIGGCLKPNSSIPCVEKIELPVGKLCEKFGVKYTIAQDVNRKDIYNKIIRIVKSVLKDHIRGFGESNDKEESLNFIEGLSDSLYVISYDAWEYTNGKARDENEYNKFNDRFNSILGQLNKALKDNNIQGRFSSDGDWDDGDIYYSCK